MKHKERLICYTVMVLLSALLCAALAALSSGAFTARQIEKYDLDGDGQIAISDVSLLLDVLGGESAAQIELSDAELRDKIEGGWIGQMAGVAWGASTEFCYTGRLIPESSLPSWSPSMINDAFYQDDLYVEIPFLTTMNTRGFDCAPSYLATAFKNTSFALWHANGMARDNLKAGLSYPDSGSYLNNYHADDIDWQIECDFLGMIYPGMPSEAAARAFELGHIMNYGDGVYGGVFISAMHAAAFTAQSVEEICEAGASVIPEGTLFKELLDDVFAAYRAGYTFEENWESLETKWAKTDLCPELPGPGNIDAKLNSGYVLLGLLYGEGDFEKTILLSMRCGQDSDCNPSSAASILGNFYGASALDDRFKSALDRTGTKFSYTSSSFDDAVNLNYGLAKNQLESAGATGTDEGWTFEASPDYIPVPFEQWPDGVYVCFKTSFSVNTVTLTEVTPYGKNEEVTGFTIDMGDGTVFYDVIPCSYTYKTSGYHTITVRVTGSAGSTYEKTRRVLAVRNLSSVPEQVVICSVTAPAGGGSKDANVICDGVIPDLSSPDTMQYDTYALGDPGGNPEKTAYIGYVYSAPRAVKKVVFTEGNHFGNGGWFKNGSLRLELLIDGAWTDAGAAISPAYPDGNYKGAFGDPYETYTLTLPAETSVLGVRLIGTAGGSAGFISVGELTVE